MCLGLNMVIGEVGQLHRLIVALFSGNYDHDRYVVLQLKYIINRLLIIERRGQMHHVVKNVHTFNHLFGCFLGSRWNLHASLGDLSRHTIRGRLCTSIWHCSTSVWLEWALSCKTLRTLTTLISCAWKLLQWLCNSLGEYGAYRTMLVFSLLLDPLDTSLRFHLGTILRHSHFC